MDGQDSIITYERLYELLRLEKYHPELQPVDKDFFEKTVQYISEKRATLSTHEHKDSIFAAQSIQKTRKQLENIQKILSELYERRESKILQLAIFCSRTQAPIQNQDKMLPEEKILYTSLVETLNIHRTQILKTLLEGKKPAIPETKDIKNEAASPEQKHVRFIQDVPQFVGEDMNLYGPYKPEDTAVLPAKVTDVLIKNKRAEHLWKCPNWRTVTAATAKNILNAK